MKNLTCYIFFALLLLFTTIGCGNKTSSGGKGAQSSAGEFKVEAVTRYSATALVPINPQQIETEGIKNPNWQVYANIEDSSGRWLTADTPPTELAGNYLRARITLPNTSDGICWLRIWGRDLVSGKWLWIVDTSIFVKIRDGNKAYEVKVNTISGQSQPA